MDLKQSQWFKLACFLLLSALWFAFASSEAKASEPSGHCYHFNGGSCKPDGKGRAFDDYFTWWQGAKHYGLWGCHLNPRHSDEEECWGAILIFSPMYIQIGQYGSFLNCPAGSVLSNGECIEPDNVPPDTTCPMSLGNPVEVLTGRKHERVEDWSSAGPQPLVMERFYSSFGGVLSAPGGSSLGRGWRTGFDAAANWDRSTPSASQLIHIVLPTGYEYSFIKQSNQWKPVLPRLNGSSLVWDQVRTDIDVGLETDLSTATLRMQDGRRFVFGSGGKLSQVLFPGGYSQSVSYTAGRLARVSDNRGRWLSFTYGGSNAPPLLTVIKTSDGKTIAYSYENRSSLSHPDYADSSFSDTYWALKTVAYPDGTPSSANDNPRQSYSYLNDPDNPFLLTSITDERGVRYAEWTYDKKGRATSSQHAGEADKWLFAYDDANNTVTVTNPLGRQTVYTYRRVQGAIRQLMSVKGIATTGCDQSDTAYAYDGNGFRSQATDAEGRITRWTRNSRGLPLSETRAFGTPAATVRSMEWDASRPLPTRIAEPGRVTDISYDAQGLVTTLQEIDTASQTVPYATKGQVRKTVYSYISASSAVLTPATQDLLPVEVKVVNPSASLGMKGWTVSAGHVSALNTGGCRVPNCFIAGGTSPSVFYQDLNIPSANFAEVDAGMRNIALGWMDSTLVGKVSVAIAFLNGSGTKIGGESRQVAVSTSYGWETFSVDAGPVPPQARKIRLEFTLSPAFDSLNGLGPIENLTNVTAQLTASTVAPMNPIRLLSAVDGPLPGSGDIVRYSYDSSGNLASVTDELGHVTRITNLDPGGRPLSVTDPNGIVTNMVYDARGRLTMVIVNPGTAQAKTVVAYDAAGQVTRVTAPDGTYLQYSWSDARRLTSVVNNGGERIDYAYNANGDMTARTVKSSTGAIVRQQSVLFDELGRLMRSIGAAGQQTLFRYDRTDNLTQVQDPRGGLFGYAYDGLQNLASLTDQAGGSVKLARDGKGDLTAYSDPRGITTNYVRNGFGEIIQEIGPDFGTTVIARDERGLPTRITSPRGIITTLSYDAAGRLVKEAYSADPRQNVTYLYDDTANGNFGIGRLTGISDVSGSLARRYDALGRVIAETRVIAGKSYVTTYGYNAAGRLSAIGYPSGRVVSYSRSTLGRVAAITTKATASAAVESVAHDLGWSPMSSRLTAIRHGNGLTTTLAYDGDGRIASLKLVDGAKRLSHLTYAYGDGMNLTAVNDNVMAANSVALAYDAAQRLVYAHGPWGNLTYAYTPGGDRSQEVLTPPGSSKALTTLLRYPSGSNRLSSTSTGGFTTRSFTYDAAGDLTSTAMGPLRLTFTYNLRNRPVSLTRTGDGTQTSSYAYNALDQMVLRSTSAAGGPKGTVHYIYGLDGALLAEADGATGATLREYIWLPADDASPTADNDNEEGVSPSPLPLALVTGVNTATPGLLMVHADHLGRPIRLTDATRATVWTASYDPFGQPWQVTGTVEQNLRFPGQYFLIESGLSYNWHRFYDPATGRYTQPDPLRFVDGPSVYGYAGASPMMRVDPKGQNLSPVIPSLCLQNPLVCASLCLIDPALCGYHPPAGKPPMCVMDGEDGGGDDGGGDDGGGDNDKERCKVVKQECIKFCDLALDNDALPDLQSMYFFRCIAQCVYDNKCEGGIDYSDEWDQGKIGSPRPWDGKRGLQ